MPETLPVVLATWAGTSSKLAALTFTKAEISSSSAKKPEAIFYVFVTWFLFVEVVMRFCAAQLASKL
jgi:hypothetical protein